MALRMKHEGLQQLTMRGAAEWSDGVLMAMRDCSPPASNFSSTQKKKTDSTTTTTTICKINMDVAGQSLESSSSAAVTASSLTTSVAASSTCTYSSICTTHVNNKNQLDEYSSSTNVASLLSTASSGVRLVLNGQPVVIGGGVHMRIFTTQKQETSRTYADFPTLVGNQWNEFTMEPHAPQGVPVIQTAFVPSQQQTSVCQPVIDMPPSYIQRISAFGGKNGNYIPYNPGTLSPEALWYATNPSYDWAYALAQYCSSKGNIAETQVMMLSSYAPMRLQRLRYQDSACFVSASPNSNINNNVICAPDLFTAAVLDASKAIPGISADTATQTTQLYDLCASNTIFNLWIETLEYFDASNIAIGVRQGSMKDLGIMLTTTYTLNMPEKGGGKTVYYFVNVNDVSQIRADIPWPTFVFEGSSSLPSNNNKIDFASCPALRLLPNVGAVLGLSLEAAARLLGVIINFIMNPFAFPELIEARAVGACPKNDLMHSSLQDCGMALLSLDGFFDSIYAANTAVWDIINWLVSVVLPPSLIQTQISPVSTTATSTAARLSDFLKVFNMILIFLYLCLMNFNWFDMT